jgi:hypothetical protein
MTTYEFHLPIEGDYRRYFIAPIYSSDGRLRQFSISQDEAIDNSVPQISIALDPDVFKQTAMPGPEVLSRIAIGQARQDNLFGVAGCRQDLFLDFAIEPWEGELTPRNN